MAQSLHVGVHDVNWRVPNACTPYLKTRPSGYAGELRRAFFFKFREVAGKKNSHPLDNVTTVEEVRAAAPKLSGHSFLGTGLHIQFRGISNFKSRK